MHYVRLVSQVQLRHSESNAINRSNKQSKIQGLLAARFEVEGTESAAVSDMNRLPQHKLDWRAKVACAR